jgi:hypothetical protein
MQVQADAGKSGRKSGLELFYRLPQNQICHIRNFCTIRMCFWLLDSLCAFDRMKGI